MALSKDKRVRALGAFAREAAVIGVLYALWELPGTIAGFQQQRSVRTGAVDRALRARHLPAVRTQRAEPDPRASADRAGRYEAKMAGLGRVVVAASTARLRIC
jgi:hypothetical protein